MNQMYEKESELIELYLTRRTSAYLSYASQCYPTSNPGSLNKCQPYVKSTLNYTLTKNATCPFKGNICEGSGNLLMETALLDSLDDFGINSAENQRFALRVRSQCAPLVTEGFSKIHKPDDSQYEPSFRLYYGGQLDARPSSDASFTYQVPYNLSTRSVANYTSRQTPTPDFVIGSVIFPHWHYASNDRFSTITDQFFSPISQLRRIDADVSLTFLSSPGLVYVKQTDDPWFSAHHVAPGIKMYYDDNDPGTPLYERDEPVGVLGCTTQYQFCNPILPAGSQCEPYSSSNSSYWEHDEKLWPANYDFVKWGKNVVFASLAIPFNMEFVTAGISALVVRQNLRSGSVNVGIPDNQWELEMAHSFEVMLASLQGSFLDNTNGPLSPQFAPAFAKPNDTAWQYMCRNQVQLPGTIALRTS
jgi:hypothetical protein